MTDLPPSIVFAAVVAFIVLLLFGFVPCYSGLEETTAADQQRRSENLESTRRRILEMRQQAMNDLNEIDADLESQEQIDEMRQTISELEGVTTTTTTFIGDIQQEDTRAKRKQRIQQQLFLQPLEDASVRSIQKSLELSKKKEEENLFRMMWRNNKRRRKSNRNRNTEEGQECSICLCNYQVGEIVAWPRNSGECTHVFHEGCITEWLKENDDCPLCRMNIMNRDYSPNRQSTV